MNKAMKVDALVAAISSRIAAARSDGAEPRFEEVATIAGVSVSTAFRLRKDVPSLAEAWKNALGRLKSQSVTHVEERGVTITELQTRLRVLAVKAEAYRLHAEDAERRLREFEARYLPKH